MECHEILLVCHIELPFDFCDTIFLQRDPEYMNSVFTSAFMESVYPLLLSPTLPQYKWGDTQIEQVSSKLNQELDSLDRMRRVIGCVLLV